MTAPARITQDDIDRAMKSVMRSGAEHARIVMDLRQQQIVIILGAEAGDAPALQSGEWTDDDT